jgi:transposase-like protein
VKKTRRNHSPAFKARVALAAPAGDKTIADVAKHDHQVSTWKAQRVNRAAQVFGAESTEPSESVDNVFVERLWRSVKHEEMYLKAYVSLTEARCAPSPCFAMYYGRRPHQSLSDRTRDAVFFDALAAAERRAA